MDTPLTIAMIAKTIDAAPLKPAKETNNICRKEHPIGSKMQNTEIGLDTKVKNSAMTTDGTMISGIWEG